MPLGDFADFLLESHAFLVLRWSDQAEVPSRDQHRVGAQLRNRAQHGHAAVSTDRLSQDPEVPLVCHPIQDHSRDLQLGVEVDASLHDRGDRARRLGHVDDQYDGSPEQFRQLRGAVRPQGIPPVEDAPVPFDHRDVRALCVKEEVAGHHLRIHHEGVQAAAHAAAQPREPGRIDVVRPLLEDGDRKPLLLQRSENAQARNRLARITRQAGDYKSR